MKASVITEFGGSFTTTEVGLADPVGREVLVDVKASGLCHTDHTMASYDLGMYPVPAVFGHELAGVVSAVGPDVLDIAVGDHVVGCLVQYCGRCRHCLSGRVTRCLDPGATLRADGQAPRLSLGSESSPVTQAFGLGGFAEQALVHESQLTAIPDAVPLPQAALLGCGVVTGAGAVLNSAQVQVGDSVVVLGAGGGVGLNAVTGAVLAGATTIVAVDVDAAKLEKATRFGATHTVDSRAVDPVSVVQDITGGGADAVFDFVGIPAVTRQGLAMAGMGGGLYLIGVMDPTATLEFSTIEGISLQRRIEGVYMGSTLPRRDIRRYAELYLQGRLNLDDLVSEEISLDEIDAGYAMLKEPGTARVVITSF